MSARVVWTRGQTGRFNHDEVDIEFIETWVFSCTNTCVHRNTDIRVNRPVGLLSPAAAAGPANLSDVPAISVN